MAAERQALQVQVDISENDAVSLAETIRTLLADVEKINVHAVADRVVITGQDINPGIGSRIDAIQKIYPTVLNFTTADPVGMRPMVQMDVKIMEFDSNALEELGIQWDNVIRGPVAGIVRISPTTTTTASTPSRARRTACCCRTSCREPRPSLASPRRSARRST